MADVVLFAMTGAGLRCNGEVVDTAAVAVPREVGRVVVVVAASEADVGAAGRLSGRWAADMVDENMLP